MYKTVYKLTDQNLQTYNGYQWELNKPKETSGKGELCGPGWLHFYYSPELALFLNPLHANIDNPRLFKAEASGSFKDDRGLKGGATGLKITEEIPVVPPTLEQKVTFAILCALEVCEDSSFIKWANDWLSGKDRSAASAYIAVEAAANAAAAAASAAASAAYYATYAATYAADAASSAAYDAANTAGYAAYAKPIDLVRIAKIAMNNT
jgi:hypothetical protein